MCDAMLESRGSLLSRIHFCHGRKVSLDVLMLGGRGGGGGGNSVSPLVIQETVSQGTYHTHTQMTFRVCLGAMPDYQGSTNPRSF